MASKTSSAFLIARDSEGGVENVELGGSVSGVVNFDGGVLKLLNPAQLVGAIALDDSGGAIDFVNTQVGLTNVLFPDHTGSFQLQFIYGDHQTITYYGYGGPRAEATYKFSTQADGHGGTELLIQHLEQSSVDVIGVQHHLQHLAV